MAEIATIKEEVICIIAEHQSVDPNTIDESTRLMNGGLNLDSLGLTELIMELDDRLQISIPDEVLPEIQTVGDVIGQLRKAIDEAVAP